MGIANTVPSQFIIDDDSNTLPPTQFIPHPTTETPTSAPIHNQL